jgi:hypothetical protein
LYLIGRARRLGVGRATLARMLLNIGLDLVLGAVPLVGDLFDAYFKANQRNVQLLKRHALASPGGERQLRRADVTFVAGVVVVLALLAIGSAAATFYLISWAVEALRMLMS